VTLDVGGRVTSLGGTSFTWSKEGFLRQAQDPIPAVAETYGVDSTMRRFARLQGAGTELYVFEGLDRVATLDASGAVVDSYLFDGIDHPLRIARPGASTNYDYYEVDLAGNVRGLRASGGASLGGYRYSAFGQTLEDTSLINQPLRWKGRWFSPVAGGTYDVRARQWSPELGVFLSIDEFGFHDRRSTLWGWPGQSPPRYRDPKGNGLICIFLTGFPICFYVPDSPPTPPCPAPPPPPPPEPQAVKCTRDSSKYSPTTCYYNCDDGTTETRPRAPDGSCPDAIIKP